MSQQRGTSNQKRGAVMPPRKQDDMPQRMTEAA
jgi:hypothetical protein